MLTIREINLVPAWNCFTGTYNLRVSLLNVYPEHHRYKIITTPKPRREGHFAFFLPASLLPSTLTCDCLKNKERMGEAWLVLMDAVKEIF